MPRPNRPRSITSEATLARRIAYERERGHMSYDGLALRMTQAGCPIQASGIYKIEKGNPPRKINVNELIGFSVVFGHSVEDMLVDPEVAESKELTSLVFAWHEARELRVAAVAEENEHWRALQDFVTEHPDTTGAVKQQMAEWVKDNYAEGDQEESVRQLMERLTQFVFVAPGPVDDNETEGETVTKNG